VQTDRLLAAFFLIYAFPAAAQSTKAELYGTLHDPSGLALASAQVRLTNASTNADATSVTGPDGGYHFFALPAGTYRLTASKQGFQTLKREGITLRVGDATALDLSLPIGDVTQQIEITAQAPLLQTSRGTASFLVDQQKVDNLPLDGRNFIPLIALSPGVALPPNSTLPRINGSRPRTSEYLYDGISVLQPEPGQVAYFPIIDAIDEFRVEITATRLNTAAPTGA